MQKGDESMFLEITQELHWDKHSHSNVLPTFDKEFENINTLSASEVHKEKILLGTPILLQQNNKPKVNE
ncbi:hypothetical protein HK096_010075, partial [Nowakowskiella sp. JEL0078]